MDNQNKDRMFINMKKTYHSTTNEPETVKEYNCTLPAEELLEIVMFELYDGLLAMGYGSESIAGLMHECAWQREPEIFSEEEKQEEKEKEKEKEEEQEEERKGDKREEDEEDEVE